jgi:hypothetical protein
MTMQRSIVMMRLQREQCTKKANAGFVPHSSRHSPKASPLQFQGQLNGGGGLTVTLGYIGVDPSAVLRAA